MSSEYTIHLDSEPMTGEVVSLRPELACMPVRIRAGGTRVVIYVGVARRGEVARVLRELAESLDPLPRARHARAFHPCPDCVEIGRQEGYEAERRPVGA